MSDGFVTLKELSEEVGLDRSNLRKFTLAQGISPVMVRTPESRGQKTLAISEEEAELIRERRKEFAAGLPIEREGNGHGFFYVVQLVPELAPNRVKLGYADNVETRVQAHRTSAPTAQLVKAWPCRKTWEQAAIDSVTRIDCAMLSGEVFDCDNLEELIGRCEDLFNLMP